MELFLVSMESVLQSLTASDVKDLDKNTMEMHLNSEVNDIDGNVFDTAFTILTLNILAL